MIKIYLYKKIKQLPDSFLVSLFFSEEKLFGPLFQKIATGPFKKMVEITNNLEEADYMLLPHTYSLLEKKYKNYLGEAELFAKTNKLQTLIFAYGDSHSDIKFSNSIVLRTAKYRVRLKENEIIIPAFVEDLGEQYGVDYIKKVEKPTVGFSGMTYLPDIKSELKYQIKLITSLLNEVLGNKLKTERTGLYFRRKTLNILSNSESCELVAQKRRTYSGAMKTIEGDPDLIRKEFVQNIKGAHLPLVIRGNGNYSLRFFEVLSLGRVPLFIDTDVPLPSENDINYDEFMLRVDYKDIDKLSEIISNFWHTTSEEKFLDMQQKAREVFEHKLRTGEFYKELFLQLETG